MLIRILAVIAILAPVIALTGSEPAAACTCALGDPRERLEEYDAAFVGRAISHPPPPGGIKSSADLIKYTFEVETAVKGDLGDTVEVFSPAFGGSCGFEFGVPAGERSGILLRSNEDGTYRGGLCTTIDPDVLLYIASPLPPPGGSGPVKYLVGGTFGEARLMALDSQGRTLAYGAGASPTGALAVCPDGRYAVEVYGAEDDITAGVRDLHTFELVEELHLSSQAATFGNTFTDLKTPGLEPEDFTALICMSAAGREFAFFADPSPHDTKGPAVVAKVDLDAGRPVSVLWKGDAENAAFSPEGSTAYVVAGGDITPPEYQGNSWLVHRVDMDSGESTEIVGFPKLYSHRIFSVAASPGGDQFVAVVAEDHGPWKTNLVLIDASSDPAQLIEVPLDEGGRSKRVFWMDESHVLLVTNDEDTGPKVFDTSLDLVDEKAPLDYLMMPVLSDGALYGLTNSGFSAVSVSSADIQSGYIEQHRKFDRHDLLAMAVVPGEVMVEPTNPLVQVSAGGATNNAPVGQPEPRANEERAGLSNGDVLMWSAASLGGVLTIVAGYLTLRRARMRRAP